MPKYPQSWNVYAFGVVLFEIISGRAAISGLLSNESSQPRSREGRTLTSLFEPIFKDPDGKTKLRKYVDPAMNDGYPIDAVWKMALLAQQCTQQDPDLRPDIRLAVVQLMKLASTTQE